MNRIMPLLVTLLFFGCGSQLESPLPEQMGTGDFSLLPRMITPHAEKLMKKSMVKGLSISVVNGQETIWQTGLGLADKKNGIPVGENTLFRYGSITKLFTTVAILDLVEQGRIDLDAPIQTYIPELRVQSHATMPDTIRVRHLLTHHSGLPGDYLKDFMFYEPLDPDYTKMYLTMPELLSHEYIQLGTDSLFSYCNNGFTLLGVIIQRVTGMAYPDYMQEHVLGPLGMDHSSLVMSPELKTITAKGYQMNREMDMPYIRDIPAGSLLSNATDMAAFMKMMFKKGITIKGDTLLDPSTVEDIFIPKNEHVPLDKNFRIGWTFWLVNPYDREFSVCPAGHGGDLPPFHAILILLPGEELGVTVATNSNTGASVISQLALEILQMAYEIKTGNELDFRPNAPVKPYQAMDYKKYEGYYPGIIGLMKLKAEKQNLKLTSGAITFELTPRTDDWFSLKLKLFGLIPVGAESMSHARINLFQHADIPYLDLFMNGISAGVTSRVLPTPIPTIWKDRTGKYKRIDLARPFTRQQLPFTLEKPVLKMNEKTGFLTLEGTLLGSKIQLPLEPLDDHMAIVKGVGRMAGQTILVEQREQGEVLKWSGMEFKRL